MWNEARQAKKYLMELCVGELLLLLLKSYVRWQIAIYLDEYINGHMDRYKKQIENKLCNLAICPWHNRREMHDAILKFRLRSFFSSILCFARPTQDREKKMMKEKKKTQREESKAHNNAHMWLWKKLFLK